jgi:hypothetical protein
MSKDRAVTLKIFLIATDENGQVTRLEADGRGPFGNFMGRSDFSTKLYQRRGIELGSQFILSPLNLKAQETVHGTLPFIIHPFGFTKNRHQNFGVLGQSFYPYSRETSPV